MLDSAGTIEERDFAAREISGLRERVIVSPCSGRFAPLPAEVFTSDGEWVEPGRPLGQIINGGERVDVTSSFRGWMMGQLGLAGQPVREGEALFWIWSC